MEFKPWIGVDLDGTIAHYDGWKGETHIGDPIPEMVRRVKDWLDQGIEVRIFTARVWPGAGRDVAHVRKAIQDWCLKHVGQSLKVTCEKDFQMIELWDDRAVRVVANTGYSCCEAGH